MDAVQFLQVEERAFQQISQPLAELRPESASLVHPASVRLD